MADNEASREHAFLTELPDGRAEIRDLGSRNGTLVNGERISQPTVLEGGEEITIGETVLAASRALSAGETRLGAAQPGAFALEVRSGPDAGKTIKPMGQRFVIGREEGAADFVLNDPEVSREHASLKELPGGKAEIRDLGSRNGTLVNGKRISQPTVLEGGEQIKLGDTVLAASGPGQGRGETRLGTGPAAAGATAKSGGPKAAVIAAAVGGGLVVVVAVLAIAGVFSGGSSGPLTAQEVIAAAKPSTLQVFSRDRSTIAGGGTAWVYDAAKGLIVTNAHVVNEGNRFQAGFDSTSLHRATVVGVAPCEDVAVLRMPPAGLKTLPRAAPSDVKQGDTVYALGFPSNSTSDINFLKANFQVTQGTISALDTQVREGFGQAPFSIPNDNGAMLLPSVVQIDAAINPGNSGGPLVNDRANLVGMDTVGSARQNQNGAISLNTLDRVVPQLAAGHSIGWAGFGVAALPTRYAPAGGGAMLITSVVKDTPADQAGLPSGLLITAVNHQPVTTQQGYCDIAKNISPGEEVQLDLVDANTGRSTSGVRVTFP